MGENKQTNNVAAVFEVNRLYANASARGPGKTPGTNLPAVPGLAKTWNSEIWARLNADETRFTVLGSKWLAICGIV